MRELGTGACAELKYGPATGFVVKFTNGLVAYLTGDTGIHSEMKTVVNEFHKVNLAVLNLGPNPGIFFSGAHAMNELVRRIDRGELKPDPSNVDNIPA